jgi:hypothetical protein
MALLRRLTAEQKRSISHWAMELMIVIGGVLIALWLQQWGERRQALQNMAVAEQAIHDELQETLKSLIWRQAINQCHIDRIRLLKSALTGPRTEWPGLEENALVLVAPKGPMGAPSIITSIYWRPLDTFTDAAWKSALATGALAPMDRKRFALLVNAYDQVQFLRDTRDRETEATEKLAALTFPTQLTPEVRSEMLQGLYVLDRSRFTYALIGPSVVAGWMRELGWNDKAALEAYLRQDANEVKAMGLVWRPCVANSRNPFSATS